MKNNKNLWKYGILSLIGFFSLVGIFIIQNYSVKSMFSDSNWLITTPVVCILLYAVNKLINGEIQYDLSMKLELFDHPLEHLNRALLVSNQDGRFLLLIENKTITDENEDSVDIQVEHWIYSHNITVNKENNSIEFTRSKMRMFEKYPHQKNYSIVDRSSKEKMFSFYYKPNNVLNSIFVKSIVAIKKDYKEDLKVIM